MGKLRLGVIGAGSWVVASHLPELAKRRDEVEFVGVSRKGTALLDKIKKDWGFQVASEDYRDVLEAGVDICLVASPTAFHFEHAMAALQSGAHVLVEKPFTVRPEDAWHLVDTAASRDQHLLISLGWNYSPMVRSAKALMNEHGVGVIEQLTLHMASSTRELLLGTGSYPDAAPDTTPEFPTWNDPRFSGGGYAMAQLAHALGIALWLTELRGDEVFAMMSAPHDAPVELHDAVAMRFTNGAIGTIGGGSAHVNAGDNKHQLEFRVIGDEGQFQIDLEREILWLFRAPNVNFRPESAPNAGLYDCAGPPHALVDLAQGRDVENCSPGWIGARSAEILEACYRSAATHAPAKVDHTHP